MLYHRLILEGHDPWLDTEKLVPGQDWWLEITAAIRDSHVVLVCLSEGSVNKCGFVQKEIATALDVADEQPEGGHLRDPFAIRTLRRSVPARPMAVA